VWTPDWVWMLWKTKKSIAYDRMLQCSEPYISLMLYGIFLIIKSTRCTNFSNLFLEWNSTCFRHFLCPSSGVFLLYTKQWYMSYRFVDSLWAGANAPAHKLSANLYNIPLLCVQWKTPDDGQRNCLKHVEIHFKNKFEKLVQLVGFVIGNLTQCMVTW